MQKALARKVLVLVCVSGLLLSNAEKSIGVTLPKLTGPSTVNRSTWVRFYGTGFPLDARVSVFLVPVEFIGGNCCGISVLGKWKANDLGRVVIAFRWPRGYHRCSGGRDCNLYAWDSGERVQMQVSAAKPGTTGVSMTKLVRVL